MQVIFYFFSQTGANVWGRTISGSHFCCSTFFFEEREILVRCVFAWLKLTIFGQNVRRLLLQTFPLKITFQVWSLLHNWVLEKEQIFGRNIAIWTISKVMDALKKSRTLAIFPQICQCIAHSLKGKRCEILKTSENRQVQLFCNWYALQNHYLNHLL